MIRINLLPVKKARRRSEGRAQLVLFAALLVVECLILAGLYFNVANQADELQQKVEQNQREVEEAEREHQSAQLLEQKQAEQQKQVEILRELEQLRTGPVRLLDELQAILSPPRNEAERHARARMNWNVEWDTRRLWLESWSEKGGEFKMAGTALNADDVAEFLERLASARYFDAILLDFVKAKPRTDSSVDLVEFSITGKLSYDGKGGADANNSGS